MSQQYSQHTCSKCKESKSCDYFYKDARYKSGLNSWCKDCSNSRVRPESHKLRTQQWREENKESQVEKAAIYYQGNRDKIRNSQLRNRFGISLNQYNEMLADQSGVCAICFSHETIYDPKIKTIRALAVDHCHSTGKVRGLLCSKCNMAIGALNDNIINLSNAITYLRNHTNE